MGLYDLIDPRELRYPANWLSLLRLLLVPLPGLTLARRGNRRHALLIAAFAMSTDVVDGYVARRRNEISDLGKILDPLADKLLIDSLVLALVRRAELPGWTIRLLVLRDLAILGGGVVLARRRSYIPASRTMGKLTTGLLTLALLLHLLERPRLGRWVFRLAVIPLALSLGQYGVNFMRLMVGRPAKERSAA